MGTRIELPGQLRKTLLIQLGVFEIQSHLRSCPPGLSEGAPAPAPDNTKSYKFAAEFKEGDLVGFTFHLKMNTIE